MAENTTISQINTSRTSSRVDSNADALISVQNLSKSFKVGTQIIPVLKDISFNINFGEFTIIFGPSGCGKSTMLHTILGLETPTLGKIEFLGNDLYTGFNDDARAEFRKKHIGMVFQQPNWIKSLKVLENVAFPLMLLGFDKQGAMDRAAQQLASLDMEKWGDYFPTELSGGQQQRISVARALVTNPQVIIADEPTGNLDYTAGQQLMQLLKDLSEKGMTIIMVTHDLEYLPYAARAVRLLDGKLIATYNKDQMANLKNELQFKRIGKDEENGSSAPSVSADNSTSAVSKTVTKVESADKPVKKTKTKVVTATPEFAVDVPLVKEEDA